MKTVTDLLIAYKKAHPKEREKGSTEEAEEHEKAGIEAE